MRGVKGGIPWAASPSGEPTVPAGNQRLEKNASAFFGMREGVTFINTAAFFYNRKK
jgi:hypothetical protein